MLYDQSTIEAIKRSRKQVTILFSDIEHSTRHWGRRGDIDARLLIDRHNRLLFPIIRKFRGKIIKTIGDAIMAAFNSADNALKAGIAIQQKLAEERERDKYFCLRARIGIHTGTGIVEEEDIFGDVVNVAAKVEASGQANDVLLTRSTRARLKQEFQLSDHSQLKLAGKHKGISLFSCDWQNYTNLAASIRADSIVPLFKRQKLELLIFTAMALLALFFIYHYYIRFLLADRQMTFGWSSTISWLPSDYPVILITQTLVMIGFAVYLLRIDFISRVLLRTLNGMFGAGIMILLFASVNYSFELPFTKRWDQPLYESENLFVQTLKNSVQINEKPDKKSNTLQVLPKGEIFVYIQSKTSRKLRWDEVQYNETQTGWIPRMILPAFGVAEEQLTLTDKFYFRYYDLYGLILAIIAFVWGYMGYRIRPS